MASNFDDKRKARYIKAGLAAEPNKWATVNQKAALILFLTDEGLDDQAKDETFVNNLLWLVANPGAMRNLLVSAGMITSEKKLSGLAAALAAEMEEK